MDATLFVVGGLLNALILGFVTRRLLGAAVGWPRTLLVSFAVSGATGRTSSWLAQATGLTDADGLVRPTIQAWLVYVLVICWAVAIGGAILVVLEAIVPTGTLPNPLAWVRGLSQQRRRNRRYAAIVAIAARHGLGGYLRGRRLPDRPGATAALATALRDALAEGGVTFVKLGQMLATRPDLVGEQLAARLSTLQADVPAEPWPTIAPVIEASLGRPSREVFASVDPEPMAAASVAQVHAAVLHDGSRVVLKVQRPSARAQVKADVDIVLRLARWLERSTGWARPLGVLALAQGFVDSLDEELDYRVELDNHNAVAAGLLEAGSAVTVPHVHADLSGSRLLVMERIEGVPVSRAHEVLAAIPAPERAAMARSLLDAVLRQIVVTGIFHADLHQGNVIVRPDGGLTLLDLGAVGRLDGGSRDGIGMLLHGIDRNDSVAATDALLDVLDRPAGFDDRAFERQIGVLLQRYRYGFGSGGSTGMFTALLALIVRHGFRVPPQVAATLRALGALEGTLADIDPQLDLVTAAREQGRAILTERFTPQGTRQLLEDQLTALIPLVQRLPRRVDAIAESLSDGRLSVNVRLLADPDDRRYVTGLVQQLTATLIATALSVCGVLLVVSDAGPQMLPGLPVYTFVGCTLFLFAFVLAARTLAGVFRHSALLRRPD